MARRTGSLQSPPLCGEVGERSDPGGGMWCGTILHPKFAKCELSTSPQRGGDWSAHIRKAPRALAREAFRQVATRRPAEDCLSSRHQSGTFASTTTVCMRSASRRVRICHLRSRNTLSARAARKIGALTCLFLRQIYVVIFVFSDGSASLEHIANTDIEVKPIMRKINDSLSTISCTVSGHMLLAFSKIF
jgi:hypothetical protein